MTDPTDKPTPIAFAEVPTSASTADTAKARVSALLDGLKDAARRTVSGAAQQAEAEAERVAAACTALVGAVLAGDDESALAQRYAVLRALPHHLVPWLQVNDVLETAVGEAGVERIKLRAASLSAGPRASARQARNVDGLAGPVASVRRGEPSYSQRLKHRAARSR